MLRRLDDAIDVWVRPLCAGAGELPALASLLDDDERRRAARYVAAGPRVEFVVARATLRQILAHYLGRDPRGLTFAAEGNGKPTLPGRELHFNVSHTRGLAVYALTRRAALGIDVERLRPQPSYLDMASRFFAPGEAQRLRELPPERREEAFFAVWTRKEAFIKAVGQGLAFGLERFEVAVPPDPVAVCHVDGDAAAGAAWSLSSLSPAEGYVAALAMLGPMPAVELRRWPVDAAGGEG